MKITLVITVKNEENSIGEFLTSLHYQTVKPTEMVVVDAHSKDQTVRVIKNFSSKLGFPVRILRKHGNRSVGRNTAIKSALHEIILVSDAGCILNSHWVERIARPFKNTEIDVVAGFYKPITKTIFEKCLSTYTCTMPDKFDRKNFLPSSRSVAFRKKAWEKAGGYPENLDTCEDLIFDKRLKKTGARFTTEGKALVYWPQRENIFQAARQFYGYAVGDGKARYFRISTPFLYFRYVLGTALVIFTIKTKTYELIALIVLLVAVYITWSIQKNYKYVKNWKAFVYLPLLQFVSDMCVLTGITVGFISI